MTSSTENNSSINNLYASFLNTQTSEGSLAQIIENDLICIDTSLNRIGINTLDPSCSLHIEGDNGKIQVKSISCENLDISGNLDLSNNNTNIIIMETNEEYDSVTGTFLNKFFVDVSGYVRFKK